MKKTLIKSLSAFLVLVLILSILPIAAFASETEEHEHTGCTCAQPVVTAVCTHPIKTTYHSYRVKDITASGHVIEDTVCYTCTTCGFSYTELTGYSYTAAHQYKLDNGSISAACLVCGYPNPA